MGVERALPTLVCASANPDKVHEIEQLLDGVVHLLPRPADIPDVVEDAETLVGNARLKAMAILQATGLPAVADDTGMFVDALPVELGVRTARYADDRPEHAETPYAANRAKLLDSLRDKNCVSIMAWKRPTQSTAVVALLIWNLSVSIWCCHRAPHIRHCIVSAIISAFWMRQHSAAYYHRHRLRHCSRRISYCAA